METGNDAMLLVFGVLGGAAMLFASGRMRLDIVAQLALTWVVTIVVVPIFFPL